MLSEYLEILKYKKLFARETIIWYFVIYKCIISVVFFFSNWSLERCNQTAIKKSDLGMYYGLLMPFWIKGAVVLLVEAVTKLCNAIA